MYYLIDGKKYLDNYMIRERLNISKSLFQQITKKYEAKERGIIKIQNKTLYSTSCLVEILKILISENDKQITRTNK